MLHRHEILVPDGGRVGVGERVRVHGPVERPPHVNYAVPALQEFWCFVAHVQLHAPLCGSGCLVDVDSRDGHAVCVSLSAADRVVEEEDAVRAGDALEKQFLDLRVVYILYRFFGVPICIGHCGRDVFEGREGIVVEGVRGFLAPDVVDSHGVVLRGEVALWAFFGRLDIVVGL